MSVFDGALGGGEQEEKHIEYGKSCSGKKYKKSVAMGITISNLIDGYGPNQISLLSLDLEGYEIEALEGLDLGRHQPSCILEETKQIDEDIRILGHQNNLLENITHHDYVFGLRDPVML
jgi:hypothetical protein